MSSSPDVYIHPAEKRNAVRNGYGTRASLFNGGDRPAFPAALQAMDDIVLEPGKSVFLRPSAGRSRLVLPLVGGIEAGEKDSTVFTGPGSWYLHAANGAGIPVRNPFGAQVNFLCLEYDFPWQAARDQAVTGSFVPGKVLAPLPVPAPFSLSVNTFGERETGEIHTGSPGLLAYVISGIFEVEDRLLGSRDALVLPSGTSFEFECFMPGGMILFLYNFPNLSRI